MADEAATFMVEDARLIFKNFQGQEGQYNREGDRSFGLVLTDELAEDLLRDGWNVKYLTAREEGDSDQPWLPVEVKYKHKPPRVVLITNNGKTRTNLTEDTIATVDFVEIKNVDLIVRAYTWGPINGKSGVKAYLKTMYVTVLEDELERKYGTGAPASQEADD